MPAAEDIREVEKHWMQIHWSRGHWQGLCGPIHIEISCLPGEHLDLVDKNERNPLGHI